MSENFFTDFASAMTASLNDLAKSGSGLANDIKAAEKEWNEITDLSSTINSSPVNVFDDEDGTRYIEVAIPGKTKENVKITSQSTLDKPLPPHLASKYSSVNAYLRIEVKADEPTEEQKKLAEARKNGIVRIKGMSKLSLVIPLTSDLDVNGLKAKVENGLLTVTVPKVPEVKPKEFTIE
jgi:HSP20 family molecular chaperone IbpA